MENIDVYNFCIYLCDYCNCYGGRLWRFQIYVYGQRKNPLKLALDTHIAFEGMIQGAGIPYAIVLYHVKGNDDREKIKKNLPVGRFFLGWWCTPIQNHDNYINTLSANTIMVSSLGHDKAIINMWCSPSTHIGVIKNPFSCVLEYQKKAFDSPPYLS